MAALDAWWERERSGEIAKQEIWEYYRVRRELLAMPITILSRKVLMAHVTEWWWTLRSRLGRFIGGERDP